MAKISWYFQLHQPYRLTDYSVLAVGKQQGYFDDELNAEVFEKVTQKSYRPMLQLLLKLLNEVESFCVTLSITGVWLEQAQASAPDLIELIQKMVQTGKLELLAETYYHSLSALYSPTEFQFQVKKHHDLMKNLFKYAPRIFRNTELIYWDELAPMVAEMGYKGLLTEAVDRYLDGQARTQVFRAKLQPDFRLLLKHAQLSDDIAFRFSDKNWSHYPLHADTYLNWLSLYSETDLINLFMDFETFGEHQWADTGIFDFFETVVRELDRSTHHSLVTPSMVLSQLSQSEAGQLPIYNVPEPISWADVDRNLTAWRDNPLQWDSLKVLYDLEQKILTQDNKKLVEKWRRLQTSDHFYYMCIKWSADGDVHAYFSPYQDPFEAYRRFSILLADLRDFLLKNC